MESTSDFLSAKIRTGGGVLVRHSKMQIEINVIYKLYMYVFLNSATLFSQLNFIS